MHNIWQKSKNACYIVSALLSIVDVATDLKCLVGYHRDSYEKPETLTIYQATLYNTNSTTLNQSTVAITPPLLTSTNVSGTNQTDNVADETAPISKWYFWCSLLSITLTFTVTMIIFLARCVSLWKAKGRPSWRDIFRRAGRVLFPPSVILYHEVKLGKAIWLNNRTADRYHRHETDLANAYLLTEHIMEGIPQVVLSSVYIFYNGGLLAHPINTCSAVISGASSIKGIVMSAWMCHKKRLTFC